MGHRRGWLLALPLLLAGCASTSSGHPAAGGAVAPLASGSRSAAAAPAALADCGSVPASDGPSRASVAISATAPASATAGSDLHVLVHLRSVDGQRHTLDSGDGSVLITRGGKVVGEYEGALGGGAVRIDVPATHEATLPGSVLLSGCPRRPVDPAAPDLTRKALPAGAYEIVVVLDDVTAKPFGSLVAAPVPLLVTADPAALPSCGDVPVSAEQPQGRVAAVLTGPVTARGGSTVQVQVMLRSNLGRQEQLVTALPIEVLVVRNGNVVGRSGAGVAGVALTVTVPATGEVPMLDPTIDTDTHLRDVILAGCPRDDQGPASRRPLPKGTYELVGVLEDGVNGPSGVLVTQPLRVMVS